MTLASASAVTLVTMLEGRAEERPEAPACTFLHDTEEASTALCFGELGLQARAIAARLQGLGVAGQCVPLLYPPGLEFLSAFFGCLYAGVIAVPLPVPRVQASAMPLLGIVGDLDTQVLLTTGASMSRLRRLHLPALDNVRCLTTEDTDPELARAWRAPSSTAHDVAYLQYTSGSTATRKGVAITHANVIANLRGIAARFRHHADSVCVNWLPHTHDLGLVAGIMQPLYHAHHNIMMSPTSFVQQPIRWLNAISRHRGTYSHSPNFGYDLCVRRTTAAQRAALDLRSWEVALNGAEPVRQQTIEAFARMFEPHGFRPTTMYPAYGLAEATLVVSGGDRGRDPIAVRVDAAALEHDDVVEAAADAQARVLVGCGHALEATSIVIVDPTTCRRCDPERVGEIWVRGPGVATGYWQRREATDETFRGRLGDGDQEPYLRTGDLGFLRGDELYVTGRLKDLIIIRGSNYYPQDIEWTVERSDTAFRPGCCAAFSSDEDGTESLIVVAELEREHLRTADGDELTRIARRAVAEEHELYLQQLVLLKTGTVPRTTSGKIQRRQCRTEWRDGTLSVVWASPERSVDTVPDATPDAPLPSPASVGSGQRSQGGLRPSAADVVGWLREYAGTHLNSRLMDERRSVTPHVVLDFGNRGVLGLQAPTGCGGLDLGYRDTMKVVEQIGGIDLTLAMMTIVHNGLGIRPILKHGRAALRDDLLPRLATGRELAAFALTEPAAGSNPLGIVSTASPDGSDGWRLHGQKSWSGSAGWSSVVNVFVQTVDTEGRPLGMSGFVVPRGADGLRIGPEALTLGMRAMVQNAIELSGTPVTAAQCLGEIGAGMKVAQDAMMQGRLQIGAACVGGMKRCVQLLARYAGRRSISTGRLLDNPVLLERVGVSSAALAAVESLVTYVARELDEGRDVPPDAYIVCKVAGSEWLWRAADDLVQFLGGRGYIETNIAAQLLRDARVTRILEGPTEALSMFLGTRVVNDGASLHRFLGEGLGEPALSARLAAVAEELRDRCISGPPRFGSKPEALRWAHALVGQVAIDAVLLAATPHDSPPHVRAWAAQHFERSVATALAQASASGFRLGAADVLALADKYAGAIGDVEQSLQGEDHALDEMLRRDDASRSIPRAPQMPPPPREQGVAAPGPVPRQPRADAGAIEQFIVRRLAVELKVPETSIDINRSFFDYGLDSVTAVTLTASLEQWLDLDINPEIVYEIPRIRAFAMHLQEQSVTARAPVEHIGEAGARAFE